MVEKIGNLSLLTIGCQLVCEHLQFRSYVRYYNNTCHLGWADAVVDWLPSEKAWLDWSVGWLQEEADLLRRVSVTGAPTTIIAVAAGQQIGIFELNNIASWPYDRNVITVTNIADLHTVESTLINAICTGQCVRMGAGVT